MKTLRLNDDDEFEISWALSKEQDRLENSAAIQFAAGDRRQLANRLRNFERVTRLRQRVLRRPGRR